MTHQIKMVLEELADEARDNGCNWELFCVPRIKLILDKFKEVHKELDQVVNGTHLDDIPNHKDDSLGEIAGDILCPHQRAAIRKHESHLRRLLTEINSILE